MGWLFSGFGGCAFLGGFVWYRLFILGALVSVLGFWVSVLVSAGLFAFGDIR